MYANDNDLDLKPIPTLPDQIFARSLTPPLQRTPVGQTRAISWPTRGSWTSSAWTGDQRDTTGPEALKELPNVPTESGPGIQSTASVSSNQFN